MHFYPTSPCWASFSTIFSHLTFSKAQRQLIDTGALPECSLNQIMIGWDGPHPVSQWEMCCNKTSYAAAHSFYTQNHGNLSVLIHPLTIYDLEDHMSRTSWLGKEVFKIILHRQFSLGGFGFHQLNLTCDFY